MAKPWERYAVDKRYFKGGYSNSCQRIKRVYHITHPDDALSIFRDNRIRSSLIQDKSKIKGTRTHVSWVSANVWPKSIYGHIKFEINWLSLVRNMNFYWVEAISSYNPTAFRILLSKRKIKSKLLTPYNPQVDDGPLIKIKGNKWYFNGKYNSEFMIDRDIRLNEVSEINCQKHRKDICCKFKNKKCTWEESPKKSISPFLAGLLQSKRSSWKKLFDYYDDLEEFETEDDFMDYYLLDNLKEISGSIKRYQGSELPLYLKNSLAYSVLSAHSQRNKNRTKNLISLFESFDDFRNTVLNIEKAYWK